MKSPRKYKKLIALAVVVAAFSLLMFVFYVTNTVITVWEKIHTMPDWLVVLYGLFIAAFLLVTIVIIVRLFRTGNADQTAYDSPVYMQNGKVDEQLLEQHLADAQANGLDLSAVEEEIAELQKRRDHGQLVVAFFGQISTGKSSLINSLLERFEVNTDVLGGSTQNIQHYSWKSAAGDELLLSDCPGRAEVNGEFEQQAMDEAMRSHIIVYVTDDDLSASEYKDIKHLQGFDKPMIICLNKADQFSTEEQQQITQRVQARIGTDVSVVWVASAGKKQIKILHQDGSESVTEKQRGANVTALTGSMQSVIDGHLPMIEQLRDASVFVLIKDKIALAQQEHLIKQSQAIVLRSTQKAIAGAIAAISPGTDIIIQGVLASQMIKQLCELHDVKVRQIDIDKLISLSQERLNAHTTIILAISGNALKAFPGLGTLSGAAVHAIAYGLIFDALGKAVADTLINRGRIAAAPVAVAFTDLLGQDLGQRTVKVARLAYEQVKHGQKK